MANAGPRTPSDLVPPFRRAFDVAQTPYAARNALGILPPTAISDAPNDGNIYGRQSEAWVDLSLSFQPLDGDLTAIAALSGTNTIYYRSGASTWSPVTIGAGLTFSGGTLSSSGGGNVSNVGTPTSGQWAQWTSATTIQGVATASTPWVLKAGDTMTGNLTIAQAAAANCLLILNKSASGLANQVQGLTAGVLRWNIALGGGVAETGSNAGSDFVINRFNDAGTVINQPILITRATGVVTIDSASLTGVPVAPTATAGTNTTQIATTAFVQAAATPAVPQRTVLTSGAGTYTTPANCKWLEVEMVGGGASGGNGQTDGSFNAPTATTFGSLTCNPGSRGAANGGGGGAGGTASGGDYNVTGSAGGTGMSNSGIFVTGGVGGTSPFGGAAYGGLPGAAANSGGNAAANSGSGGGGGSAGQTYAGSGGGAGGYLRKIFTSPSATYSYSVGAGGSYASGGAGGAGGSGGSGVIIVTAHFGG